MRQVGLAFFGHCRNLLILLNWRVLLNARAARPTSYTSTGLCFPSTSFLCCRYAWRKWRILFVGRCWCLGYLFRTAGAESELRQGAKVWFAVFIINQGCYLPRLVVGPFSLTLNQILIGAIPALLFLCTSPPLLLNLVYTPRAQQRVVLRFPKLASASNAECSFPIRAFFVSRYHAT